MPESVRIIGNRYLLTATIESGSLGNRYEAIDQQLSKAVKFEQKVCVELFSQAYRQADYENQVAAKMVQITRVAHPNLLKTMDFGIDGDTAFLATELLQGVSLRTAIDQTPTDRFSENEIYAVFEAVAKALACIEESGFTHFNLTPDSVFITQDHEIKIVDFASEALKRLIGQSTGQRSSDSQPIFRADEVFRFAGITYEMLTNEKAFASLSQGGKRRVESTLRKNKHIPGFRRKALLRTMTARPDQEVPTLAEFVRDFRLPAGKVPKIAKDKSRTRQRSQVNPLLAFGLVASAAALLWVNRDDLNKAYLDWSARSGIQDSVLSTVATSAEDSALQNRALTTERQPTEQLSTQQSSTENLSIAAPTDQQPVDSAADNEVSIDDSVVVTTPPPTSDPLNPAPAEDSTNAASIAASGTVGDSNVASLNEPSEGQPALSDPAAENARYPITATGKITPTSASAEFSQPAATSEIAFQQASITVGESESMASISVGRQGDIMKQESLVWWTASNTAMTDLDYAELGVQIETLESGQENVTLYIPIVSDAVAEERESFFVYASIEESPDPDPRVLQVFIIDDDGASVSLLND